MINKDSLNYGALYSFEPEFLRHITEDEVLNANEVGVSYHLDKTDTKWSGILVILVFILLIGLIISLTTSVSRDSIARLSGASISHVNQYSHDSIH